jgi:colicin import membrane protein
MPLGLNAAMNAANTLQHQRLEFAPPPTPGIVRAMGLAIIAHMLLVAALTWGVRWKRDAVIVTAEAELWSAVPQAVAPKLIEAPSPPPAPEPVVKAPPPPVVAPKLPDVDIVLERDKQREIKEKQEAKEKIEKDRLEKDKIEKAKEAEKLKAEEAKQAKEDKAQKALEDKKKAQEKLAVAKQAAEVDAKKSEMQRQENIKRMAGLAGATGGAAATGTALQSSGPSPGYAGRIRARIKPNIVFTADIAGNPTATVEVRVSPDGTITSRKLLKSSGNAAWDEAVLKAVDKTEVLPRDTDGQVPSSMEISFRPKD